VYDLLDIDEHTPNAYHSLEGEWTGHAFYNDRAIFITITAADDTFRGRGRDYHGAFDICGRMGANKSDLRMTFVCEEVGPLDL
jgi:hypothetical protein